MKIFNNFWECHPALLYGLTILLSSYAAINFHYILLLPLVIVLLTSLSLIRIALITAIFSVSFLMIINLYQFPHNLQTKVFGTAEIHLSEVKSHQNAYGKQWLYVGKIKYFTAEKKEEMHFVKNVPIKIVIPQNLDIDRPLANRDYQVRGYLKEFAPKKFSFSIPRDEPWVSIENNWNWSEIRFKTKQFVQKYISDRIENQRNASFLTGLATGNFDDQALAFEFSRFGLQHIMAISGFHFGIIAAILSCFLRLIFARDISNIFLIFILSSYFIFIGPSPSVMRSWITILLALVAFLIQRTSNGLNSLGIALIVILMYDPLMCLNMGFQFSFIATAGILTFFPFLKIYTEILFVKRPLSIMVEMKSFSQHAYLILFYFRQSLALGVAVNLVALPLCLYYFQKFPLMGVIYNLFYPFLVSISMLLLMLGAFFSFLPPISQLIHDLNNAYTGAILDFTYNWPMSLDYMLRMKPFSSDFLIIYLTLLFCIGIYIKERLEIENKIVNNSIPFI